MAHDALRSRTCLPLLVAFAAFAAGCSSDVAPEAAPTDTQHVTAGGEPGNAETPQAAGSAQPLPAATKGYELYAWEERGTLMFTLITGTNRLKAASEIVAPETDVEQGDWVVVHGEGLDALARVLARVPAGTSVVLGTLPDLPALSAGARDEVLRAIADSGH